ncbi:DNA-directed RNA polymerase subunit K [Candidatus Woesearchaeota archaeon]|nr:MAG: DNA-directed RNA polymerase subunit K [Candidatus Woesearchaeota archaeon]
MTKKISISLPEGYVTKYEKARLIGTRALQISMGAPLLVKLSKKELEALEYNPIEIAKREFEAGKLQIEVDRKKITEKLERSSPSVYRKQRT